MIWIIIFDFFTLDFQVRFSNRDPGWGWFFSNRFKLVLSRIGLPKPIGSWYLVAIFGNFTECGNVEKKIQLFRFLNIWTSLCYFSRQIAKFENFSSLFFRIRLPKPIGSWYMVTIFGNFNGCGNGEKDSRSR